MGVLSDIIVADRAQAPAINAARGRHLQQWAGADLKGLDTIKLGSLWQILSGVTVDHTIMADALDQASSDGPWVFLVPPELVTKMAALDEESIEPVAEQWAATEECALDRWKSVDAEDYLNTLAEVSRKAKGASKDLLLWMSL
jgi:hypothetical protein